EAEKASQYCCVPRWPRPARIPSMVCPDAYGWSVGSGGDGGRLIGVAATDARPFPVSIASWLDRVSGRLGSGDRCLPVRPAQVSPRWCDGLLLLLEVAVVDLLLDFFVPRDLLLKGSRVFGYELFQLVSRRVGYRLLLNLFEANLEVIVHQRFA